jgi:RHS repeat-associated protein
LPVEISTKAHPSAPKIWLMSTEAQSSAPAANPNPSYYRARYYDPNAGRFLSEDPIGFGGGTDFYTYVLNNPTDYIDPRGLKTQVCCRSLRFITGFLSGLNHCYVKITPDGGPSHTYGLHREDANGVLFPGGAKPIKDDKTDKGGACSDVPNATPCKERAFEQGFDKIPNCQSCGKNYFGLTTNSNYWVSNTLAIFDMSAPAFNAGDASPGYQPTTPGGFGEK